MDRDISTLVMKAKSFTGMKVFAPTGLPKVEKDHVLPEDLKLFYKLCGGMELYKNGDYPIEIFPPEKVVRANPIIIGDIQGIPNSGISTEDISENWYIIAHDYNGDYTTIDLSRDRLGRCYDSFHELHPGNSPIIAKAFTDLVEGLIDGEGQRWYWLRDGFASLGKAYDDVYG